MLNKQIGRGTILSLFLILSLTTSVFSDTVDIQEQEEQKLNSDNLLIEETIKTFISEDYNFNGGNNVFSTVGNDNFKKYLKMRNEIKELNNKNDNYISYNNNYEFKFANLQKKNDIVTANVEVTEEFTYDIPTAQGEKAMVRNDYEVILQKKGNTYYILSANIDTDADPIDGEFNANKELGYIKDDGTDNSRQSINSDDISNTFIESNLYKINNRMNEIKISIGSKDTIGKMITPVSMRAGYENVTDNQRNIIRDYAKEYAFKRNPNYLSFENDCANFASQALRKAGGRADKNHKIWIDNKYRTWSLEPDSFHIQPTYGDAWAQAHYLRAFIVRNDGGNRGPGGHGYQYGSTLKLGDLCFLHNGKSWFHTYIVVRPGPNFGVAAHTKDRYNVPINEAGKIPGTNNDYERTYIHIATLN